MAHKITNLGADLEIREYPEGLDEIVASNASVHIEEMCEGHWWMSIRTEEGEIHVNFWTRNQRAKINASWNQEPAAEGEAT